jgi:hypothetical protein
MFREIHVHRDETAEDGPEISWLSKEIPPHSVPRNDQKTISVDDRAPVCVGCIFRPYLNVCYYK